MRAVMGMLAGATTIVVALLAGSSASAASTASVTTAATAVRAAATGPVTWAGSCTWQNSTGILTGVGPSTITEAGDDPLVVPVQTVTPCTADRVQPLARWAPITSPFGMRVHPITGAYAMHNGTDYSRSGIRGEGIRSIASGTVAVVSNPAALSGAGNTIIIAHDDGSRSQYMHMNAPTTLPVGARVAAGQVIGYVGTTGASTGPHLHLQVWVGGVLVDPATHIAATPFIN